MSILNAFPTQQVGPAPTADSIGIVFFATVLPLLALFATGWADPLPIYPQWFGQWLPLALFAYTYLIVLSPRDAFWFTSVVDSIALTIVVLTPSVAHRIGMHVDREMFRAMALLYYVAPAAVGIVLGLRFVEFLRSLHTVSASAACATGVALYAALGLYGPHAVPILLAGLATVFWLSEIADLVVDGKVLQWLPVSKIRTLTVPVRLAFRLTYRARLADCREQLEGIPFIVLYAGGLELMEDRLLRHFKSGRPDGRFVESYMVYRRQSGQRCIFYRASFLASTDSWAESVSTSRPIHHKRQSSDLWLTMDDYREVFLSEVQPSAAILRAAER